MNVAPFMRGCSVCNHNHVQGESRIVQIDAPYLTVCLKCALAQDPLAAEFFVNGVSILYLHQLYDLVMP